MTIHTNSGLVMAMESALAAAKTISAITNAAPGVISATGHGYANGDFVLLEIQGMVELDKTVYEVANIATDTFELIGPDGTTSLDTTGFSTFSSGTAKKITFGTSITGVQDFSPQGGDIKFLDSTTVHDTKDKQIASGVTAMSYNLTIQWDPANAGQAAMRAAFDVRAPKCMRVTWPNGAYVAWYGSVGYNGAPGGGNQAITTTQAALSAEGNMTVAA